MGIKKKVLIIPTILLVILATIYSSYYFSKLKKYNNILSSANQAMSTEEYDKAIDYYTEALNYKKDVSVSKKIELVKLLKKSKESYDSAVKQMSDKKYLEAIDLFKKVDKQDDKRYSTGQSKINECTKLYVADNLNIANDNFKNNKFDEANKYIDNILKIDTNNSSAKKLKDNILVAQKEKEENEHKGQEDEKKKSSSAGTFVTQNTLLNKDSSENLSRFVVTLSDINENKAKISYFTSSKGGSVTSAEGTAEYQGNGEWHFEIKSNARYLYMIGVFSVNGNNATFNEIGTTARVDDNNEWHLENKLDLKDLRAENSQALIRCDNYYNK